jgi:hypothetical protein
VPGADYRDNFATIQSSDYQLLLRGYAPVFMALFLTESAAANSAGRYVFVTVGLNMEGRKNDHQATLCI